MSKAQFHDGLKYAYNSVSAILLSAVVTVSEVIWSVPGRGDGLCNKILSERDSSPGPRNSKVVQADKLPQVSVDTLEELLRLEPLFVKNSVEQVLKEFEHSLGAAESLEVNGQTYKIVRPLGYGSVAIAYLVEDVSGNLFQAKAIHRQDFSEERKGSNLKKNKLDLEILLRDGYPALRPIEIDLQRYILLTSYLRGLSIWDLLVEPPTGVLLSVRAEQEIRVIWSDMESRLGNTSSKNLIVDFSTRAISVIDPGG